jgi:hypothetical protein
MSSQKISARLSSVRSSEVAIAVKKKVQFFLILAALSFAFLNSGLAAAQSSKVMGELQFQPASKAAAHSGVWIDGQYVGFMSELHGNKKIMLLPGSHQIAVRQVGYTDLTKDIVVEPGSVNAFEVKMIPNTAAQYPGSDGAELKLDIKPKRAAVFVDDGYVGNAGHFGGANTMVVSPGTHRIKVELPGYKTFETEINLLPHQTSRVETELASGSIQQQAGSLVKEQ